MSLLSFYFSFCSAFNYYENKLHLISTFSLHLSYVRRKKINEMQTCPKVIINWVRKERCICNFRFSNNLKFQVKPKIQSYVPMKLENVNQPREKKIDFSIVVEFYVYTRFEWFLLYLLYINP